MSEMKRSLGLVDATMIVAGSMIGSGIFIVASDMTRQVGGVGWLLLAWILTAIMTWSAALSYGELSAMYPKAGGQYTYLQKAFGPLMGFLYGWTLFTVIQTGTIAAVGVAFAKFTAYFIPFFELKSENPIAILNLGFTVVQPAHILSIAVVTFLTWINTRGVESGKWIQTMFTIAKIASLLLLIVLGFLFGFNPEVWNLNWSQAWQLQSLVDGNWTPSTSILVAMSAAMVGSIFSADAWNNITFIAGEVKNPQRNIGLSLVIGTGIVLILYLLTNLMYTSVLTSAEIANAPQDRVAIAIFEKLFGTVGTKVLAALIMISTFGCINGMVLSGARVMYTMAEENQFLRIAKDLNVKQVPSKALWLQGIWTALLCLSGKYGALLDYVVIAVLIFYVITLIGIFKLRKTEPTMDRPYKAVGYPFLPILYILMASVLSICLLLFKTETTLPGILLVLIGVPVYYIFIKHKKSSI